MVCFKVVIKYLQLIFQRNLHLESKFCYKRKTFLIVHKVDIIIYIFQYMKDPCFVKRT
jgi:hypothetical protein